MVRRPIALVGALFSFIGFCVALICQLFAFISLDLAQVGKVFAFVRVLAVRTEKSTLVGRLLPRGSVGDSPGVLVRTLHVWCRSVVCCLRIVSLQTGRLACGDLLSIPGSVGAAVSVAGSLVPLVGKSITLVGVTVPSVGMALSRVGVSVPFGGELVPLIGELVAFVGVHFA